MIGSLLQFLFEAIQTHLLMLHVLFFLANVHHDLRGKEQRRHIFHTNVHFLYSTVCDVTCCGCLVIFQQCPGNMQAEVGHQQPEASNFHYFISMARISRSWTLFKHFLIAKSKINNKFLSQPSNHLNQINLFL